jgi:hypothetical protein
MQATRRNANSVLSPSTGKGASVIAGQHHSNTLPEAGLARGPWRAAAGAAPPRHAYHTETTIKRPKIADQQHRPKKSRYFQIFEVQEAQNAVRAAAAGIETVRTLPGVPRDSIKM